MKLIFLTWLHSVVYNSNKLSHNLFCCSSDSHFASCENIEQTLGAISTDILGLLLQHLIGKVQVLTVRIYWLEIRMVKRGVVLPLLIDKERLIWFGDPCGRKKRCNRQVHF